jgi:hypothetical protein
MLCVIFRCGGWIEGCWMTWSRGFPKLLMWRIGYRRLLCWAFLEVVMVRVCLRGGF